LLSHCVFSILLLYISEKCIFVTLYNAFASCIIFHNTNKLFLYFCM
jgi:hypothetical protein